MISKNKSTDFELNQKNRIPSGLVKLVMIISIVSIPAFTFNPTVAYGQTNESTVAVVEYTYS